MILVQQEKLNKVRDNINLSNEVLNELKEQLQVLGVPESLTNKLIYVATTKTEFEFKEKDLIKSLDLLYFAKNYKND